MLDFKRGMRHVVVDAHRKMVFGIGRPKIFVNGADHGGVEFLGAKTVSAAYDLYIASAGFSQSGHNVKVKGLA